MHVSIDMCVCVCERVRVGMWQADLHCSVLEMCPALVCSTDGKFPVCTAAHNYCLEGRRARIYHPSKEKCKK